MKNRPSLAKRAQHLPFSPIRKLVPLADAAKARGLEVLHFNIGQPDLAAPKEALEKVQQSNLDLLPYGDSQGPINYRKKLCQYYHHHQVELQPEDILVTTGASEALSFTINTICDPDDEIIIPEPFYANYNGFASAASARVIPVVSKFENGFQLPPLDLIETHIGPKTKAILICNPNNPTGYLYSEEEIRTLGEMALKHNIFLIVDEVYREFVYDGDVHFSVLAEEKWAQHTIMIDSVSKRFSMCGARVGCLVSRNHDFLHQTLKLAQFRLSPPTYALMASEAALDAPREYMEEVRQEYARRRATVVEAFGNIEGVEISTPKGAFYSMMKLPVENAEDFSKFLLTDFELNGTTLMLAPANGFYSNLSLGNDQIRFAFVLSCEKIKKAAAILTAALDRYKAR